MDNKDLINCSKCYNNINYAITLSDDDKICYHCYFNIKYSNNENFDNLMNNDQITIYDYYKKFNKDHNYDFCNNNKCLLCDINKEKIIKNLKKGEKIYGKMYNYIGDGRILYNETLKLEVLLHEKIEK